MVVVHGLTCTGAAGEVGVADTGAAGAETGAAEEDGVAEDDGAEVLIGWSLTAAS